MGITSHPSFLSSGNLLLSFRYFIARYFDLDVFLLDVLIFYISCPRFNAVYGHMLSYWHTICCAVSAIHRAAQRTFLSILVFPFAADQRNRGREDGALPQ